MTRKFLLFVVSIILSVYTYALSPWTKGAFETGRYRNVFVEMGYENKYSFKI